MNHKINDPDHVADCHQCQANQYAATIPPMPKFDAVRNTAAATDDDRVWLDERAAIREYDGNQTRTEAEAGAVEDYFREGES